MVCKKLNYPKKLLLIALDSSVLCDLSKDYFHTDKKRQEQATNTIVSLYNSGGIPVLSWHHIEELLAHKNDSIVSKSIALIRKLPCVASLRCHNAPYHIGSIMDVETLEFHNILNTNNARLKTIIEETKRDIFHFCSGKELLTPYLPHLDVFRQLILARTNRKKEIASISRARSIQPQETKLSTLKISKLRSAKSAESTLYNMQKQLEEEIRKKGDSKIQSPENTAKTFIASILESGKKLYSSSGSTEERFLKVAGVTSEETKEFVTLDQLQYLAIFKRRLNIISTNFTGDKKNRLLKLKEESCPSWLLWKALHKIRIKAEKASGSDLNDGYLAGLIFYADLTIVDKRTNEYLSQIKQKDTKLNPLISTFTKLSHYSDILDHL